MSDSPSYTNGAGNDLSSPPLSPTSPDDEPDYEGKLKQVLGSDAGKDEDEDEGDDEFGDFVYHGKDAPGSDEEDRQEGYAKRLKGVLGSAASRSDDGASSAGTPKKPRIANGNLRSPQMVSRAHRGAGTRANSGPSSALDTRLSSLERPLPRRPHSFPLHNRLPRVSRLPSPSRRPSPDLSPPLHLSSGQSLPLRLLQLDPL